MKILGGGISISADGTITGSLDLQPDKGEIDAWYARFEKQLPASVQGFDGVHLAADGIRVRGARDGIPFDVGVTLRAEAG